MAAFRDMLPLKLAEVSADPAGSLTGKERALSGISTAPSVLARADSTPDSCKEGILPMSKPPAQWKDFSAQLQKLTTSGPEQQDEMLCFML